MTDRVSFRMTAEEYAEMRRFMERHGIETVSEMVRLAVGRAVFGEGAPPRMTVRMRGTDEILRGKCAETAMWCMRARRRGGLTTGQTAMMEAVERACVEYLEYRRDEQEEME